MAPLVAPIDYSYGGSHVRTLSSYAAREATWMKTKKEHDEWVQARMHTSTLALAPASCACVRYVHTYTNMHA